MCSVTHVQQLHKHYVCLFLPLTIHTKQFEPYPILTLIYRGCVSKGIGYQDAFLYVGSDPLMYLQSCSNSPGTYTVHDVSPICTESYSEHETR